MKKQLITLIALLLPILASAYDAEIDGIYYDFDETAKTATVTYKGFEKNNTSAYCDNVSIPTEVTYNNQKYSVTSIGNWAFWGCGRLTSITIPNSVTSISDEAFYGCTQLYSVSIPSSVSSIGCDAFYNTGWYNNQTTGPVYLDNCLIGFIGEKPIGTFSIIEGTRVLAAYAFANSTELNSVEIPNSLKTIGAFAFSGCTRLTSIEIANSVTSIEYAAFKYCSSLTSFKIPNGVTRIGAYAFDGCRGLTSIEIPISVTDIGFRAFYNCTSLTTVYISDIESWFMINFEDFIFPTRDYQSNPLYYANHLYLDGEEVKELIIPNGVTEIPSYFFYNCSCFTSVTIPSSVTSIGDCVFGNCTNLISVSSNIIKPYSIKSNVFSTETYRQGTLYIPAGTEKLYTRFDGWREFLNIMEIGSVSNIRGDLNNDGKVDAADVVELVNIIMGQ